MAQNKTVGTKVGFVPESRYGVGSMPVNDGTVESNLNFYNSLKSIPKNHLPHPVYDVVSFSTLENNKNTGPSVMPSNIYVTGMSITVLVEFSEAIMIIGQPVLILEINQDLLS